MQGDEEETRIAFQRKQTHEADTWREMSAMPKNIMRQADTVPVQNEAVPETGMRRGERLSMKFIRPLKKSGGAALEDDDDEVEEDTDLPQGTRCRYRGERLARVMVVGGGT